MALSDGSWIGLPGGRTVSSAAGVAFLAVAVFLATVLVAPGLLGAEASYVVQSDSMSPAIGAGDVVVLASADATAIEAGTVVTFTTGPGGSETRITHRVVGVEQTDEGVRYRTQGDANEDPDPDLVAPSQVVGTVWYSIPLVGYLVSFANTGVGLLALVVVPAVALAVSELYALYVETDPDRKDESDDGGDGS